MRRALLSWTLVFALLAAGFAASVLALNNDLYSAGGFVRSYLAALQRGDADEALAMDGVVGDGGPLLVDAAVGGFDTVHIISDVELDGQHTVRAGYTMGGQELVTQYTVERVGTRLGFFSTWRFAVSPTASVTVRVDHDTRFSANGVDLTVGQFTVLVPTAVTLKHDTEWLAALKVVAAVTEVGSTVDAGLEVAPKEGFAAAATEAIGEFLDGCAAQQVLKPTGCPFGTDVANRLNELPTWTIVDYSIGALEPAETAWQTTGAGTAHITVDVKALFDGTVTTLDADRSFTARYIVTIGLDDSLTVTLA